MIFGPSQQNQENYNLTNFKKHLDWISNFIGLTNLDTKHKLFLFKYNAPEGEKLVNITNSKELLENVKLFDSKFRLAITCSQFPLEAISKEVDQATKLLNILIDIDCNISDLKESDQQEIIQEIIQKINFDLKDYGIIPYIHFSGNKGFHFIIPVHLELTNDNKQTILQIISQFREFIRKRYLESELATKYDIKLDNVNPISALMPIPYTIHPSTKKITLPIAEFRDGYDFALDNNVFEENWKIIQQLAKSIPKKITHSLENINISDIELLEKPEIYSDKLIALIGPYIFIKGQRHNLIYGLSGLLRRCGFSEEFVLELFTSFNNKDIKIIAKDTVKDVFKQTKKIPGYNWIKDTVEKSDQLIKELTKLLQPIDQKRKKLLFWFDEKIGMTFSSDNNFYITRLKSKEVEDIYTGENKYITYIDDEFIVKINITFKEIIKYHDIIQINYLLNNDEFSEEIKDLTKRIKADYSLSTMEIKYLTMFFYEFISFTIKNNGLKIIEDPISLTKDNIIKCSFEEKYLQIDLKKQLFILHEIYNMNTNQKDFILGFCYHLFDALAYIIRSKGNTLPFLLIYGIRQSGKSSNQKIWIVTGYDQTYTDAIIGANSVQSIFMLTHELSKDWKPKLIDDILIDFFQKFNAQLKGAASSTILGKRGNQRQLANTYSFLSNPSFTMNQEIELNDAALSFRSIQSEWTDKNKNLQNTKLFKQLVNQLIPGFYLKIIHEILNDLSINEIYKELEEITDSEKEYNQKMLDIAYIKIKKLYEKYELPFLMDKPVLKNNTDNDPEIVFITELLDQDQYIAQAKDSLQTDLEGHHWTEFFHRPYLTEQNLDVKTNLKNNIIKQITIYLSNTGFKEYAIKHKLTHWKTLTDYINNSKLDPKPKLVNHRFKDTGPRTSVRIELSDKNWIFDADD